jgi:hypothetical protein
VPTRAGEIAPTRGDQRGGQIAAAPGFRAAGAEKVAFKSLDRAAHIDIAAAGAPRGDGRTSRLSHQAAERLIRVRAGNVTAPSVDLPGTAAYLKGIGTGGSVSSPACCGTTR